MVLLLLKISILHLVLLDIIKKLKLSTSLLIPMFRRKGLAKKLLSIVEKKTKIKPKPQDPISPLGEKLFNN